MASDKPEECDGCGFARKRLTFYEGTNYGSAAMQRDKWLCHICENMNESERRDPTLNTIARMLNAAIDELKTRR